MLGHASIPSPMVKPTAAPARREGLAVWQRRTLEALVAAAAFAIWGMLAYAGGFRLLARAEGISLSTHWLIDVASLLIGVSGSIAGVSALWAIAMRALGRTPRSLVGAPDDGPIDAAYRDAFHPDGRYRGESPRPAGRR
jgi:hypothetical protein